MIPDTSAMDRPLRHRRLTVRRAVIGGGIAAGLAVAGFALFPTIRRWVESERAVDGSSLRYGEVTVGDLDRDVVSQGRVVAALHPTLFSPAQGIATLAVKAGANVV